jgi:hypothetical protein
VAEQRRWYLNGSATAGYAVSTEHKRMVLMSREILGLERGDKREADHENRDRLDNRRSNLRA